MADRRAAIYHSLAMALEAGLPITRALNSVASGARGRSRHAWNDVVRLVKAGNTLAAAMARHPQTFASFDILVVEVAETSGNLPDSVKQLAQSYDRRHRLKQIIIVGMLLPTLLFHIAAVIIPLMTLIRSFLLGEQINLAAAFWQVVFILAFFYLPIATVLAIVYLTPQTGPLRRLLDTLLRRIPLLGRGIRHLSLSRYCRAFSMLCRAGLSAHEAARGAAQATGNTAQAALLAGGAESALSGRPISEGFSAGLPKEFLEAWQVAEETGTLDDVSRRLADNYTERAELIITEFCRWVPRLVYGAVSLYIIYLILTTATGVYVKKF